MPRPPDVELHPGDQYACPRCHETHIVERPYAEVSTAERNHLYITCRGARYFIGQVKAPHA